MRDLKKEFTDFLKAGTWSGAGWLATLCVLFVIVATIYITTHAYHYDTKGREYVTLDKTQLKIIKKYLDDSINKVGLSNSSAAATNKTKTDSTNATSSTDTTSIPDTTKKDGNKKLADKGDPTHNSPGKPQGLQNVHNTDDARAARTELIVRYLEDEYDNKLIEQNKNQLDTLMRSMSDEEVYDYLTDKKLLVESAFWLTGTDVYIEAFLWSLLGVLVSLIFYVGTANVNTVKSDENDVSGPFDPSEIPSQVAKMFYAPAVTIVIVLGYHFFTDETSNMADISVNKGLIVFSFIAGFYSGRLMKFLDRLKDLLLPFDGKDSATTDNKKDVIVTLKLSPALAAGPNAATITTSFPTAVVSINSQDGSLSKPFGLTKDSKGNTLFMAKEIPTGTYTLKASVTTGALNAQGQQVVQVTSSKSDFELLLQ